MDDITCPVILFQGLEDEIVPPGQAEAMVEAVKRKGIPVAYVPFEGEQHGFRKAESIETALCIPSCTSTRRCSDLNSMSKSIPSQYTISPHREDHHGSIRASFQEGTVFRRPLTPSSTISSSGWTDGLPVVPPTAEKIGAFLDVVGRSPSAILGTEPVRGRVVTVEKVAINAVMAGCRPEYFPVALAAIEAMLEPEHNLHAVTVSTMGAAPLLVVNGPVVKEIGLNSGVSVFGPGHRANATIGRAIRLTIMNATGAVPGDLDQSSLGHAGKYTWCIAEDEETSPWQPLHVDRGYASSQSAVTVFPGLSPIQVSNFGGGSPGNGAEERSGRPDRGGPEQRRDRGRPHA